MIVLYHNNMSTCAQKVRYVLAEKGLDWESVELNLRKGDQHTEDYLKLNPAGVVPTLVNGDAVIVESGVICEYLDDLVPAPRMRPGTADRIAAMRLWIKYVDETIHAQAGVVSTAIAFRFQHLANGEDAVRARIEAVPDEAKRARMRTLIFEGVDSPLFAGASGRSPKCCAGWRPRSMATPSSRAKTARSPTRSACPTSCGSSICSWRGCGTAFPGSRAGTPACGKRPPSRPPSRTGKTRTISP